MTPLYGPYKGVMETSLYKQSPYLPFHMTESFYLKKWKTIQRFFQIFYRDVSMTPLYGSYKGVMETSRYKPFPYLPFHMTESF